MVVIAFINFDILVVIAFVLVFLFLKPQKKSQFIIFLIFHVISFVIFQVP
jgi:hypothetical protein